jgi:hypothetical protein
MDEAKNEKRKRFMLEYSDLKMLVSETSGERNETSYKYANQLHVWKSYRIIFIFSLRLKEQNNSEDGSASIIRWKY